jgi:beta-aspartyl-peptidase (threonine type)
MTDTDRPPIVRLTWRAVATFLLLDLLLTVALVVVVVKFAFGAPAEASSPQAVLDAQVAAWNRGDLEGFMDGYWRSDELTFFSDDQVTRGWQATLERYRKKYQAEGKEMGRVAFSELRIDAINDDWSVVRGRWKLTFKDGTTPGGLFTLFFRKINGQWRVIHDHTSAEKR